MFNSNSSRWSLDDDLKLLNDIKNISGTLITQTEQVLTNLDQVDHDSQVEAVKISNIINEFQMLANSQFVENRVYDEEIDELVLNPNDTMDDVDEEKEEEIMPKIKDAINKGVDFVTEYFDKLDENQCLELEEDEEADYLAQILSDGQQKNRFFRKKLPFIIGSDDYIKTSFWQMISNENEEQLNEDHAHIENGDNNEDDHNEEDEDKPREFNEKSIANEVEFSSEDDTFSKKVDKLEEDNEKDDLFFIKPKLSLDISPIFKPDQGNNIPEPNDDIPELGNNSPENIFNIPIKPAATKEKPEKKSVQLVFEEDDDEEDDLFSIKKLPTKKSKPLFLDQEKKPVRLEKSYVSNQLTNIDDDDDNDDDDLFSVIKPSIMEETKSLTQNKNTKESSIPKHSHNVKDDDLFSIKKSLKESKPRPQEQNMKPVKLAKPSVQKQASNIVLDDDLPEVTKANTLQNESLKDRAKLNSKRTRRPPTRKGLKSKAYKQPLTNQSDDSKNEKSPNEKLEKENFSKSHSHCTKQEHFPNVSLAGNMMIRSPSTEEEDVFQSADGFSIQIPPTVEKVSNSQAFTSLFSDNEDDDLFMIKAQKQVAPEIIPTMKPTESPSRLNEARISNLFNDVDEGDDFISPRQASNHEITKPKPKKNLFSDDDEIVADESIIKKSHLPQNVLFESDDDDDIFSQKSKPVAKIKSNIDLFLDEPSIQSKTVPVKNMQKRTEEISRQPKPQNSPKVFTSLFSDNEEDDLFKVISPTKQVELDIETRDKISDSINDSKRSVNLKLTLDKAEDDDFLQPKPSSSEQIKSKVNLFSDKDFGNESLTSKKQPSKKVIFESDDDDDLFSQKSKPDAKIKSNLFEDLEDDLFSSKKKTSQEKSNKSIRPQDQIKKVDVEDPLTAFLD